MSNKIKDGGRAFPSTRESCVEGLLVTTHYPGMSLRDYFAAKAMQAAFAGDGALMIAEIDERYDETNWAEVVSANAYEMADAMIAEREKEKS